MGKIRPMQHPVSLLSPKRYKHTMSIAVLVSCLIVGVAAMLGRATLNLQGAVVNKPDIAVLILMEERGENIVDSTLLRDAKTERDYLVETESGPKWVRLKQGQNQWFISEVEELRE